MTTSTTGLRKILAENPPKYCTICGSDLVESFTQIGYDAYTGYPTRKATLNCSKNKLGWFAKWVDDDHDEWQLRDEIWYLEEY
jgi:hypothetical protein